MVKEINYKQHGFRSSLVLRFRTTPIDKKWFVVEKELYYSAKNGETFFVPPGTNTDFATIPRIFRPIISRVGRHAKAAVLHDYLCEFKVVPRKKADRIFLEAMESLGVPWLKRRTMYTAVRTYSIAARKK